MKPWLNLCKQWQSALPLLSLFSAQPQLNTTQVMNNFVNQQPTQNTQSFLELLNSFTGGDGNIYTYKQIRIECFLFAFM